MQAAASHNWMLVQYNHALFSEKLSGRKKDVLKAHSTINARRGKPFQPPSVLKKIRIKLSIKTPLPPSTTEIGDAPGCVNASGKLGRSDEQQQ